MFPRAKRGARFASSRGGLPVKLSSMLLAAWVRGAFGKRAEARDFGTVATINDDP